MKRRSQYNLVAGNIVPQVVTRRSHKNTKCGRLIAVFDGPPRGSSRERAKATDNGHFKHQPTISQKLINNLSTENVVPYNIRSGSLKYKQSKANSLIINGNKNFKLAVIFVDKWSPGEYYAASDAINSSLTGQFLTTTFSNKSRVYKPVLRGLLCPK